METILFKIILSSVVLIGFYYLFLEKERIFKFNRSYLLIALVFSYIVPFIPIKNPWPIVAKSNLIVGEAVQDFQIGTITRTENVDWMSVLLIGYLLVSGFFLIKFFYSIFKIKFLKGEPINYRNQKIVIIDKEFAPFSFLNTIYLNRHHFNKKDIDERIFLHEKCHIDERHSLDILFVEFLKIFSWFNPALYFYKKAMINNHEFLADEFVLQNNDDLENYQYLILNQIKVAQNFNLTHQFDFNNTKKRFIMMTSKNSKFAVVKKFAFLPALAILFVFFTKKVDAQTTNDNNVQTLLSDQNQQNLVDSNVEQNSVVSAKSETNPAKFLKETVELKSDTIRKKQVQKAEEMTPPPPPPPSAFKQTPAEFPDGSNALRNLVATNFDTSIFNGNEGLVQTTVYLSIDEKGNVSNVTAAGTNEKFNSEAVRSFKLSNGDKTWKPASENGQSVKTVFRLPLTMKFADPTGKN